MDNKELQRIDNFNQKKNLLKIHSELEIINSNELEVRSKIIRDANGKIKDENHTTIPFLTKYERTRVLGCRAKQINNNSDIFIKNDTNIINSYLIAKEELKQKKIPFIIQRPLPSGISEYWKVSDLELLDL